MLAASILLVFFHCFINILIKLFCFLHVYVSVIVEIMNLLFLNIFEYLIIIYNDSKKIKKVYDMKQIILCMDLSIKLITISIKLIMCIFIF